MKYIEYVKSIKKGFIQQMNDKILTYGLQSRFFKSFLALKIEKYELKLNKLLIVEVIEHQVVSAEGYRYELNTLSLEFVAKLLDIVNIEVEQEQLKLKIV